MRFNASRKPNITMTLLLPQAANTYQSRRGRDT